MVNPSEKACAKGISRILPHLKALYTLNLYLVACPGVEFDLENNFPGAFKLCHCYLVSCVALEKSYGRPDSCSFVGNLADALGSSLCMF